VKEVFQGKTIWEGIVEVFELHGHPRPTQHILGRTKQTTRPTLSGTLPFLKYPQQSHQKPQSEPQSHRS
jgi:hypothetical protein